MTLTVPEIIHKKREGGELDAEDINFFVRSVVDGTASESQIGAWLMAMFFRGMTDRETAELTQAMAESGERLRWDESVRDLVVDKHSTGGVGDKVSLVLAPALAATGLKVPMISGRGLGFTGGTLDKLESIPGYRTLLTCRELEECLKNVGCFIVAQSSTLAVADRILYQHRDSTATVDSIPLIVSSILSKKCVEDVRALVLDVKVGCGAILKTEKESQELIRKLIDISKRLGVETSAVVSDMNVPLGRCIGNALEVAESVDCLRNEGCDDLVRLVKVLGGVLLRKKGSVKTIEDGEGKIAEALANGSALRKFSAMLVQQGVSPDTARRLCDGDYSVLPSSRFVTRIPVKKSGVVREINAASVGLATWRLGAGRTKPNEAIDHAAGIKLLKFVGDDVKIGEDWAEVHHGDEVLRDDARKLIEESLVVEEGVGAEPYSRILRII